MEPDTEILDTLDSSPSMPDTPRAVIVALAQAALGIAVAFGLDLTVEQQQAILGLVTALAVAIPLSDAWIRHGRAGYFAAVDQAKVIARSQGEQQ